MTRRTVASTFQIIFVTIIFLTLVACVTTRRVEPLSLPVMYQPMFASCAPSDGAANILVRKDDGNVFSSALVWAFEDHDTGAIQFNSPLGDTILEISHKKDQWTIDGNIDVRVSQDSHRVLNINGYELPLLSDELGCVVSGFWPISWLNILEWEERSKGIKLLRGSDRFRDIELSFSKSSVSSSISFNDAKSCVLLKWGGFLGIFRRSLTICREKNPGEFKMTMFGLNGYLIDWNIIHE